MPMWLHIIHHNPQPSSHTLAISANANQGNQKLGIHAIAPKLCPPLPMVTTMTTMMVKKAMARGGHQRSAQQSCTASSGTSVLLPPPIGWALSALCRGREVLAGDATVGSNNEDNDNANKGEDKKEVD